MSDILYPEKSARITGIGQSEVGRPSKKSALRLTMDACLQALGDAGLSPSDIDGIATYPGKSTEGGGIAPVGPTDVMLNLGIPSVANMSSTHEGPGHLGAMLNAVMAVATGTCRHVLLYRTVAQASARLISRSSTLLTGSRDRVDGFNALTVPFNAISPVNLWALHATAYFAKYGATSEQLGWVAVNGRTWAGLNPNAIYRKPITIDDYMASRVISTPLRLFDCDSHVDGSSAFIISHKDAAKDLKNPPIHIEALGVSQAGVSEGHFVGDFTSTQATKAGDMMWAHTDLSPKDVHCAQIYDGFSILTLMWLEAVRLCGIGEAASFVDGGKRIGMGGELPMNTSGGQLSQGRLHGYGHSYEACLQLWGRGGARQVEDAKTCVVANGGYGYGAVLLRRD
jgi:acetyl-CoA acetyltransferase